MIKDLFLLYFSSHEQSNIYIDSYLRSYSREERILNVLTFEFRSGDIPPYISDKSRIK